MTRAIDHPCPQCSAVPGAYCTSDNMPHAKRALHTIRGNAAIHTDLTTGCAAVTGDGIGLPTFADRLACAAGPFNERVICSRADIMGTRRFYSLLRGDQGPTLREVIALARACEVRPEWLAFGSGARSCNACRLRQDGENPPGALPPL